MHKLGALKHRGGFIYIHILVDKLDRLYLIRKASWAEEALVIQHMRATHKQSISIPEPYKRRTINRAE